MSVSPRVLFTVIAALGVSSLVRAGSVPPLLGSEEANKSPVPVVNIFSPEQRPGSGTLTLTSGTIVEKIELGSKTGLYGTGLIMHSSDLPAAFREEFPSTHLIQLAFGRLSSQLGKQVPQFGTLTLVTKKIPTTTKVFQVANPKNRPKSPEGMALVLMGSPAALRDRLDVEKLGTTFIGQSGTIRLIPQGKPEEVLVQGEKESYSFRSQGMKLELDCTLGTPFNPQKTLLKGKVDIAIFWPFGKRAEQFVARISSNAVSSMSSAPPPAPPQGITQHPRDIAGSNKADVKTDNRMK